MSGQSTGAVFLSYASQDAEAAQRICGTLQAAGIEVWFDQTGLGGGDAWDAEIRGRIRECALFVPLISANTESRLEGYFRLEWRLAEQRTHQMARGKPFLVPVVIDDTREDRAHVPDCFVDVQWTRLPGGDGAESFARRIKSLLMQTDAAPVAHGSARLDAPDSATSHRSAAPEGRRHSSSAGMGMAVTAAILIGIAALWVLIDRRTDAARAPAAGSATAQVVPAAVVPASAPRTAVAVMPFANLTGDASKDFLGDGMAEELINKLSRVEGLRVPARTSTFSYKGRNADARQIARDLNVGTILEGSVRSAGTTVRITAQLVDAQTDSHLWSETYDRGLTDLFKLQDELAAAIVQALQVNLHGLSPEASVSQTAPTQDIQAYQLYLQASSLSDRQTDQNYQHVLEMASQALQRDPKFARAYGVLAFAHLGLYQTGQPVEHLTAAGEVARKALQIGPDATAGAVVAHISAMAGRWLDMEKQDNEVLALASGDANAVTYRAIHLVSAGKLRAALEVAQRAYALAPANSRAASSLAWVLHEQGRDAEASRFADLATALGNPRHGAWLVGTTTYAERQSGQFDAAADLSIAALAEVFDAAADRQALAGIVRAVYAGLAEPSRRAAGLTALSRLYPTLQATTSNPLVRVRSCGLGTLWYVLLGDIDRAYELAMRCADLGDRTSIGGLAQNVYVDLWGPDMRPFRRDPRFQSFIARSGLMEYWQQYGPPDDCDLSNGKLTCH